MKCWIWICLEIMVVLGTGLWIYLFPESALAKGMVGFAFLCLIDETRISLRRNKMKKQEKYTPTKWYVHQDGDDLFVTRDLPLAGKIYEGSMDACSGFVDGFKKRLNTEIKACRTCQNPYCSRTLEERQQEEVQVHLQYGWECEDKEKWLSHSGGFEFIKKEKK